MIRRTEYPVLSAGRSKEIERSDGLSFRRAVRSDYLSTLNQQAFPPNYLDPRHQPSRFKRFPLHPLIWVVGNTKTSTQSVDCSQKRKKIPCIGRPWLREP